MDKLFRQVSVKERLPEKPGVYDTDFGKLGFRPNNFDKTDGIWSQVHYVKYPSVWYEELELPTEDEILEYARDEQGLEDYDMEQDVFVDGANYILNTLKGEKRNT